MLNLKETELCLGLPGGGEGEISKINGKRGFSETVDLKLNLQSNDPAMDLNDNIVKNSSSSSMENNTKDNMIKPPAKYVN